MAVMGSWLWLTLPACLGAGYLFYLGYLRLRPPDRLRVLDGTPLAPLADALLHHGDIYRELVELGMSSPGSPAEFRACGFDDQNGWHWLDVAVDPAVLDAWLDSNNQRRVRALLNSRILLFKPTGDLLRLWWIPPGKRTARYGRDRGKPPPGSYEGPGRSVTSG